MNKATFSRLIKDSTYISDADVLALEQVVQAFPYCQTAHMLLAKAASDKGSMLAPQRLRKAAIHAPSRAILKNLVEGKLSQKESEQVLTHASAKLKQTAYNEEIEDLIENDLPTPRLLQKEELAKPVLTPAEAQSSIPEQPTTYEETNRIIAGLTPAETEEEVAIAEAIPTDIKEPEPETTELLAELTTSETEEEVAIAESVPEENLLVESVTSEVEVSAAEQTEFASGNGLTAFLTGLQEQDLASALGEIEIHHDKTERQTETGSESTEIAVENEVPEESQAEKVIGEINSEPGLSEELLDEVLAEPETEEKQLAEEIALANLPEGTLSEEPALPAENYSDSLVFSIFRDNELGYAMSSSRMGESLQQKSELTREVPFHFQPELLVEYQLAKTGYFGSEPKPQPKPEPHPQQDLIDDFLKQAAKSKPRAAIMPKPEEQEDLSQKSTRLSKSLVSENLAQIFAMQGKTKKAIKIYQQLQLKMPEKKDYFAVLINKLQNHSS